MGTDGSNQTSAEVRHDGFGCKVAITYGVEHGSMGAKESTPTHTYGCKHSDGVAIYPTMGDKAWYKT